MSRRRRRQQEERLNDMPLWSEEDFDFLGEAALTEEVPPPLVCPKCGYRFATRSA